MELLHFQATLSNLQQMDLKFIQNKCVLIESNLMHKLKCVNLECKPIVTTLIYNIFT